MSTSTLITATDARAANWPGRLVDYAELTKPRILVMVLVTVTLSALVATWGQPDVARLLHTLLGTTLVAASASALNQWWERTTDARMLRTADRPLPAGRLGVTETLLLGLVVLVAGLTYLWLNCGESVTIWAGLTWLLYVGVYTPLKSRTWWNTAVGAIPGALPVVIGWSGVGASLDARTGWLFLLVFFWQFPHFMAIAWLYRRQYAAANLQMLTVVDASGLRAGLQAVIGAIAVVAVSLLPVSQATSISWYFVAGTSALGLGQLACAVRFLERRDDRSARRLLRASLVYLPIQLTLITLLNLSLI